MVFSSTHHFFSAQLYFGLQMADMDFKKEKKRKETIAS